MAASPEATQELWVPASELSQQTAGVIVASDAYTTIPDDMVFNATGLHEGLIAGSRYDALILEPYQSKPRREVWGNPTDWFGNLTYGPMSRYEIIQETGARVIKLGWDETLLNLCVMPHQRLQVVVWARHIDSQLRAVAARALQQEAHKHLLHVRLPDWRHVAAAVRYVRRNQLVAASQSGAET